MTLKTISLVDRQLAPIPEVVEVIETLLAKARSGELRGVAVAGVQARGLWSTAYVLGDGGLPALNLAVDVLKSRLVANPVDV